MIRKHSASWIKRGPVWMAVALAAMIPFAAYAQTNTTGSPAGASSPNAAFAQRSGKGGNDARAGGGAMFGNDAVDTSALTEEQKTVYDQATALYEEIEDQVLSDLVSAGVVTQTDVDDYTALRASEKSLTSLDMSAWTAEQYKAYYEAVQETGEERKAAMQALADAGQITQAQADALSAQGQGNLWSTISQNASTNSAIQTAMSTMRQAYATYRETLNASDIPFAGKDNMRGNMQGQFGSNRQTEQPSMPNGQSGTNSGSQQSSVPQSDANGST